MDKMNEGIKREITKFKQEKCGNFTNSLVPIDSLWKFIKRVWKSQAEMHQIQKGNAIKYLEDEKEGRSDCRSERSLIYPPPTISSLTQKLSIFNLMQILGFVLKNQRDDSSYLLEDVHSPPPRGPF